MLVWRAGQSPDGVAGQRLRRRLDTAVLRGLPRRGRHADDFVSGPAAGRGEAAAVGDAERRGIEAGGDGRPWLLGWSRAGASRRLGRISPTNAIKARRPIEPVRLPLRLICGGHQAAIGAPPDPPSSADSLRPARLRPLRAGRLFPLSVGAQRRPPFTPSPNTPRMAGVGEALCAGDTVLETEDLTKDFAGFVAVRSVNLRVARGAIHAMIGPNGAGKTTCFNLLSKFLQSHARPHRLRRARHHRAQARRCRAAWARALVSDLGRVSAFDGARKCAHRAAAPARRIVRFLAQQGRAARARRPRPRR